jgi:SAM-dependent methyltransferase
MSAEAPGAHWQRSELVSSYLDRREILLPLLDLQEDVITRLLERHPRVLTRFLDLGAGDGAMSALVYGSSPGAHGVLVDHSEPMLARAGERLGGSAFSWEAIRADLASPDWREQLPPGRFDLVVSGLAIHHLPAARKRELFAELYGLLEPGGLFVNMDYVTVAGPLRGLFDEDMRAKALHAEHAHGGSRSAEEVDLEDDHDLPDPVLEQLQWLREAGFADTEIHFKWAEAAIFGGTRPEGASS